jgi:prepilin-type N-terminal cleavage/methylation domain-containing protein
MRRKPAAFTLVELLVVIGIIATLAGFLFPTLSAAKARSFEATHASNLHQLGLAWEIYSTDNSDQVPTLSKLYWGSSIDRQLFVSSCDSHSLGWANADFEDPGLSNYPSKVSVIDVSNGFREDEWKNLAVQNLIEKYDYSGWAFIPGCSATRFGEATPGLQHFVFTLGPISLLRFDTSVAQKTMVTGRNPRNEPFLHSGCYFTERPCTWDR